MSMMLALIHAGWSSIRSSVEQGRRTDALDRLRRLLARPDVPAAVAADAHRLAGELLIDVGTLFRSPPPPAPRRRWSRGIARTYYLWALAEERDPLGCDRRAAGDSARRADWRRETRSIGPHLAARRCGAIGSDRGVRELLAAADAATGDLAVIRVVVEGTSGGDRPGTRPSSAEPGQFPVPRAEKSREFRGLVERVRFAWRGATSAENGGPRETGQDAETRQGRRLAWSSRSSELSTETKPRKGEIVRRDVVSLPRPHFPRLRSRKADR